MFNCFKKKSKKHNYGDNIFINNIIVGNNVITFENPEVASNQPLQPDPNATLWRYMSFWKFKSFWDSKSLFFSLVSIQEDENEGFMVPPEGSNTTDQNLATRLRAHLVNCWTIDEHESLYMWDNYVKGDGIVIRTTFIDLQNSIINSNQELVNKISFGEVKYVDYTESDPTYPIWAPLFHKRKEFSNEKEVRALLPHPEWDLDDPKSWKLDPDVNKGRSIPVCLNSLVKEVIVSPHSNNLFFAKVWLKVKKTLPEVNVSRSILNQSTED